MREIKPTLGRPWISQQRDKRICPGLQKGGAAGDYEQSEQEVSVLLGIRGGPEKKCTRAIEKQPDHEARFIAVLPHHESGGNREQEISHIESRLNQARSEPGDLKRLHELLDEDVVHVAGNTPEQEQGGDQNKRHNISRCKQAG